MTSVAPIALDNDFQGQAPAASEKVETAELDSQVTSVKNKINELLAALSAISRDDNTLVDALVRLRNLHPEVRGVMGSTSGWQPKAAVACASTANLTLSGEQTIDGVTTSASRVLVKNQSTPSQNGIYVTAAGAWTRATDADSASELGFAIVTVSLGSQAGQTWIVSVAPALITIGSTSITWVLVNEPESYAQAAYNVRRYGATGDGTTIDGVAIASAIAAASAAGGGTVYLPGGRYRVAAEILVPSNIQIIGDGIGRTVIVVDSSLPLTDAVFQNTNGPVAGVRVDHDIAFVKFSVDGSGRAYPAYLSDPATGLPIADPTTNTTRNPAYTTSGQIFNMLAIDRLTFSEVEIYGHAAMGINEQGGRHVRISRCRFHDNGKIDDISSPIWSQSRGTVRFIADITKANPAVVTLDGSVVFANGDTVVISGVRGMAHVPDGNYTVAGKSGQTFQLLGIDTTTDAGFVYTGQSLAVQDFFVPSEDVQVSDCDFYDNKRSAMSFMPVNGGAVTGCTFRGNGESTIFSVHAKSVIIANNRFIRNTLTDIAAAFIEASRSTDYQVVNNHFEGSESFAVAFGSIIGGRIANNVMRNIKRTAGLTYPYGPLAERWDGSAIGASIAGTTFDSYGYISVHSLGTAPCADIIVNGNVFIDDRTTPLTTYGILFKKAGDPSLVYDVIIADNDFRKSGVATNGNMIYTPAGTTVLQYTLAMRGNLGHASENPVQLTGTIAATGITDFNFGFIPRMVFIRVWESGSTNYRASESWIVRDRTNTTAGTLGNGMRAAIDAIGAAETVSQAAVTNEAYRITDASGTVKAKAIFQKWLIDTSGNQGLELNVQTATDTVNYVMIAFP